MISELFIMYFWTAYVVVGMIAMLTHVNIVSDYDNKNNTDFSSGWTGMFMALLVWMFPVLIMATIVAFKEPK